MSREARTIIISHGSHTIRAGLGIHEVLRQPTVNLSARVGLRRSQKGAEGIKLKPSDYLVGGLLDEALQSQSSEDPIEVSWPMVNGEVRDWDGMAALWYHILFFLLPITRSANVSVTLLSLPPQCITRSSSALINKIFFDEFNTPAFCLVDSALASSFAVGQMLGAVVDVGARGSSVACVFDALMAPTSVRRCDVGLGECMAYLASLLAKDANIVAALQAIDGEGSSIASSSTSSPTTRRSRLLLDLAHEIFAQGHVVADEASAAVSGSSANQAEDDNDGNFDVLGALTSGREKEVIAEQERRNRELAEQGKEPEAVVETAGDMAGKTMPAVTNGEDEDDDATVPVPFKGRTVRVAKSVLSSALTPFLDPSVLNKVAASTELLDLLTPAPSRRDIDWSSTPSLPATIHASISTILDVDRRNALWEHLIVTGAPVGVVKGLTPSLVAALQRYVAAASSAANGTASGGGGFDGGPGDEGGATGDDDGGIYTPTGTGNGKMAPGQPTNVRALRTPDYFSDFKERVDLAPFLGATIYAKLVFADTQARGYTLKGTYSERGPGYAFAVQASEK